MTGKRFTVSLSPHIRHGRTIRSMILTRIAALAPAALWGFYQFGSKAILVVATAIVGAAVAEATVDKLAVKPYSIRDFHAVSVGLILGLLLPAGVPLWLGFIGGALGVLIGKKPFGPLGGAPLSPALVGLLILAVSWPAEVTRYVQPSTAPSELKTDDAAPAESPEQAAYLDPSDAAEYDAADLFLGMQVGSIGAISPLLLLVGGLFALWRKAARWQAPLGFLLATGVAAGIAHGAAPYSVAPASFYLLTGGAFFGAFFLCTEWTSTPVTPWGMFVFGALSGGLAIVFRVFGMPFGGVPWAIVLISLGTPLLDRIATAPFGKSASHA
jgi:electron transport complex protein RnfD